MRNDFIDAIMFFLISQKYAFKNLFAYRIQAGLWLVDSVISLIGPLIPVVAIYTVSSGLPGWSFLQILVLSESTTIVTGIIYMLIGGGQIVWFMQRGGIDVYLLRPYGKFTVFISSFSDVSSIAMVVPAVAILGYVIFALGIAPLNIAAFILMLFIGAIAIIFFLEMIVVLAYHLFRRANFFYRMTGAFSSIGNYPLSVYGRIGVIVLSTIFPISLAYYYPAIELLNGVKLLFLSEFMIGSAAVGIVSYYVFYYLMRTYASGGG